MTDLSKLRCVVVDSGGWCYVAERLARDFSWVGYWIPLNPPEFPKSFSELLGKGMRGVERIQGDDVFRLMHGETVDLWVFPDVYMPGLQAHLRALGQRVWGMADAEKIETDRWYLGEILEKYDLARPDRELVKGVDNLGKLLKSVEDRYVKVNRWRGDVETFHHENWFTTEPWFRNLESDMGVARHEFEFVVEEPLEGVEIGFDGWCIDGQYPQTCLWGPEVKDLGYIGRVQPYAELPAALREVNDKLAPFFKEQGSRGFYSTEVRVGKDKIPYLIDPTCRAGSPPMQAECELWKNFSQIIYEGAGGNVIEPIPVAPYCCIAIIESKADNPHIEVPIDFPKEYADFVKFRDIYIRDGKVHVLPQGLPVPQVGAVVGLGDTIEEALDMAKEIADTIKGCGVEVQTGSFEKAKSVLEEAKSLGIEFE